MASTKLIIQLSTIAISDSLQTVSLVELLDSPYATPSRSLLSPPPRAGSVMYQTSPEEPGGIVGKLCHKHSSDSVLLGCYTIQGSTVGDKLN